MSLKIGELFVALGFKADQKKLSTFEGGLQNAKIKAVALTAAITGTTFAVLKFTDATLKYAVQLKNFAVQTGLSVQQLEKWRFVAEQNDVSGAELINTIKGIQRAGAEIKLGTGNIRPWQLLGIDPNDDPFTTLEKLRVKVKDLDPALAASVLSQLGIGQNFLNILKSSNLEFDKLNEKFLLTKKETKDLIALNKTFKDVIFSLRGLRNRMVAISAKPLEKVAKAVKNIAKFIIDLVHGITDVLNRFTFLKKVVLIAATAIAAFFFPVTAGIIALMVIIDDLYVFLQGGESLIGDFIKLFDFTSMIVELKKLKPEFEALLEFIVSKLGPALKIGLVGAMKVVKIAIEGWVLLLTNAFKLINKTIGFIQGFNLSELKSRFTTDRRTGALKTNDLNINPSLSNTPSNQNVNNNNNVNINVNESATPALTAKKLGEELSLQLSNAYHQTPVFGTL